MKITQLFAAMNGKGDTGGTTGWIPPSGDLATMPVEVQRYGVRTWAVYLGNELLCVTEYMKGARAVKSLVEQLQDALRQARSSAEPASEPMDFNEVSTMAGA